MPPPRRPQRNPRPFNVRSLRGFQSWAQRWNGSGTLSGVSRDSTGAVLGSCTMLLFDQNWNLLAQTVSDATTGAWSFAAPNSQLYNVASLNRSVSPNVAGMTIDESIIENVVTVVSPTSYPNLFFWANSDNVTLSSGKGRSLTDLSGNGRTLTTDLAGGYSDANYLASVASLGGKPALGWTSAATAGSGWKLQNLGPFTLARPFITYAVFRFETGAAAEANPLAWLCNDTSEGTFAWELDQSAGVVVDTFNDPDGSAQDSGVLSAGAFHVVAVQVEAPTTLQTKWSLYVDSYTTPVFTSTQAVLAAHVLDRIYLGSTAGFAAGNAAAQFSWAEEFIYAGVHDISTRQSLMSSYLGNRFSLPVTA